MKKLQSIDVCLCTARNARSHTIDSNNERAAATATTPESVMNRPQPLHMCRNVLYFDQSACIVRLRGSRRSARACVCAREQNAIRFLLTGETDTVYMRWVLTNGERSFARTLHAIVQSLIKHTRGGGGRVSARASVCPRAARVCGGLRSAHVCDTFEPRVDRKALVCGKYSRVIVGTAGARVSCVAGERARGHLSSSSAADISTRFAAADARQQWSRPEMQNRQWRRSVGQTR